MNLYTKRKNSLESFSSSNGGRFIREMLLHLAIKYLEGEPVWSHMRTNKSAQKLEEL